MKYTVHYSRKIRLAEFDVLEISLTKEFDDSLTPYEMSFTMVKNKVEAWIRKKVANFSGVQIIKQPVTIDVVSKIIPIDLKKDLYFEDTGDYVLIKSRRYLSQKIFKKIAEIVIDQLGGEYISAGRNSHFRIKKRSG